MTTKLGSNSIVKKMLGNKEVLKEVLNGVVVYTNTPPVPSYISFSSPNTFTIAQAGSKKTWDGSLYYSTDALHWNTWSGTTTLHSSSTGDTKYLYIRGSGNTYITGNTSSRYWSVTGSNITIEGNIENLLDYQDVENNYHPTMGDYAFMYWLYNNTSIVDCSNLILGTLTLAYNCYNSMFVGCANLTSAPELPATTLANSCYNTMFSDCTSLTTAPALPATSLAYNCYYSMFRGCSSLNTLPALPATTLADYCYYEMFRGCSNIKISLTQTGIYQTPYRIPTSGTGTANAQSSLIGMFRSTGGTFTDNPAINTTYYTSNNIIY